LAFGKTPLFSSSANKSAMSFLAQMVGSGGAGELKREVMGIEGSGRVSKTLVLSGRIPVFL